MLPRELPLHPNLEQYKKQAKDLVKDVAKSSPEAVARIRQHHPRWQDQQFDVFPIKLTDAQLVIAREHSFETWPEFARHVRNLRQVTADARLSGKLERYSLYRMDSS